MENSIVPRGFPTPPAFRVRSGPRPRTVPTALIVEDDETLATSMAGLLEDEGYATAIARTVSEARAALKNCDPHVLILDLTLPDAFGGELLHELAENDDAPPTVLVTTFPLARMLAARHEVELVKKPFVLDDLLAGIRRARDHERRPRRAIA
jgi:two-component system nitrogen regulation response regulator NtrX